MTWKVWAILLLVLYATLLYFDAPGPQALVAAVLGTAASAWIASGGLKRAIAARGEGPRHIAGPVLRAADTTIARASALLRRLDEPERLQLSGVDIPREVETGNIALVGAPGTGKSQTIKQLFRQGRARGDRFVVIDPSGECLQHFFRTGDVILNPCDSRSARWSPYCEFRHSYDYFQTAQFMIGDGDGSEQEWNRYAMQLVAAILKRTTEDGIGDLQRLLHYATHCGPKELAQLIEQEPLSQLTDRGSEKMLSCVRSIIATTLSAWSYLQGEADFSLRRWIQSGTGALFLTYRDSQWAFSRSLLRTWIQLAFSEMLERPADEQVRTWFLLDEVASLGRLDTLPHALARMRKHGASVVLGMQSVAQLRALYGGDSATAMLDSVGTWQVMSTGDPETAEYLSRRLGECIIERKQVTKMAGTHDGVSTSWHRLSERVVTPTQIQTLPPLTGYLTVKGQDRVHQIEIKPLSLPKVATPIQEREDLRLRP